jgi:hypothetical protein
MNARRLSTLLAVCALAMLALPRSATSASPPSPPDPTCSPGPANCFAWHNSNVTVSWAPPPSGVTALGCVSTVITTDTAGQPVSCMWKNADGSRTTTTNVRRDATPPTVTGVLDRTPDARGWYNHAVYAQFSGADALSGVSSCSSGTYSGPDSKTAQISGTCKDRAGNSGGTTLTLRYDATPPTVEGKPDRPPNAKGWYNSSVRVTFVGSDAVSGVHACDPPALYEGPDSRKATVSGTCRDRAKNTSPPTRFALRYDTRAPRLSVRAETAAGGMVLTWTSSKDTSSVTVVRQPGLEGDTPWTWTLDNARSRTFTDKRVKPGVEYAYTVIVYDEAGNRTEKMLVAELGTTPVKPATQKKPATKRPAVRPANGARLGAPPLIAWRPVPEATYYNLQVYRAGRKILTVWPGRPAFQLRKSWRFEDRTYRLTRGRYVWYVWAGFGPRSARRYGALLVTRSFVLTR